MKIKDLIEKYSELELSDDILKQLGIEVNISVDKFEEPKHGEKYYYIGCEGTVFNSWFTDNDDGDDKKLFKSGNCYPTKHFTFKEVEQIAEKKFEYDAAVWELKREIARLNDGWVPDWENSNEEKWCVYNDVNTIACDVWYTHKFMSNWKYLKSYNLYEQLIKTHSKQLKIYLEIE